MAGFRHPAQRDSQRMRRYMSASAAGVSFPAATGWSSSRKGASITLSTDSATMTNPVSGWQAALGALGQTTGKRQFELILAAGANDLALAGVANDDFVSYSDYIGDATNTSGCGAVGFHFQSGANWYEHKENNTSTNGPTGTQITGTDVLTVGIDFTAQTVYFYKNGTLILTRTGFTSMGTKPWYPAASAQTSRSITLRGASLSFPISGYTDWYA